MSHEDDLLFHEKDLFEVLKNYSEQIPEKVNAIPKDQFLLTPEDIVFQNIYSSVQIEHIVLYEDKKKDGIK